jgi:hypothetical protein
VVYKQRLEIPDLADALALLQGGTTYHHQVPPPDTTLLYGPVGGPLVMLPEVVGRTSAGAPGDDGWCTLGELEFGDAAAFAQFVGQIAGQFSPAVRALFTTLQLPILYHQKAASVMRWIQTTHRGTLAGVEQFQFALNWGTPGDDPDLSEAGLMSFAESVRDLFKTEWTAGGGGTPNISRHSPDVVFTEVGAATLVITDGTNADGSGGNLSQPHPTQWAAWSLGLQPIGTATGGTTVSLPFEVACALTFQSDTRGARGRGRAYMPPFASNVMSAGGVFNNAISTAYGASMGVVFDAVTAENPGIVPVVVSKRAVQLHPVTSILVGRVPDSQRRRRRSQDELRALAWSA